MLIYLAVTGKSHTRDTLAAMFWPNQGQRQARAGLRRALSELHKIMGGKVISPNVDLLVLENSPDFWLDTGEFNRCLDDSRAHAHQSLQSCPICLENLAEAVRLYRDDFLVGFSLKDSANFDDWLSLETESLRRGLVSACKPLVIAHQERGETDQAISYARRWLAIEPTDEIAHRLLMQLYAASDQRSAALRQYQECARILGFELGIMPTEETSLLNESILSQKNWPISQVSKDGSSLGTSFARRVSNLPAQVTSFIGRQVDLETLKNWMNQPEIRLVTLIGPAGVGKTRLSLQTAQRVMNAFPDGISFVALAHLKDALLVPSAIAASLGLRETIGKSIQDSVLEYLHTRQFLLILDNFEHLLSAAPLVGNLLSSAPGLKILVTSRASLQVYGEHLFQVQPLSKPDRHKVLAGDYPLGFESVQLFFERLKAMQMNFDLNNENGRVIAEICFRLDGLPLAIELAAARARSMPLLSMLAQFDGRYGLYPFHLMTDGPNDVPTRHKTLLNALLWSFDLLEVEQQILFRRLAVFSGGFTAQAVEKVCRDQIDVTALLESLVDQSLVIQSEVNGELRFDMLYILRAFALEHLDRSGEEGVVRRQHAEYYLSLLEAANSVINTLAGQGWRKRLEQERENLRAVLIWSLSATPADQIEARLKAVLKYLGIMQIPLSEQRLWIEKALAFLPAEQTLLQKSLEVDLCGAVGGIAYFQGDYSTAQIYMENQLLFAKDLGDQYLLSSSMIGLSWTVHAQGDLVRARALAEEALRISKEIVAPGEIAHALNHLAYLTSLQGDYDQAVELYLDSQYFFREAQDALWEAHVFSNMGQLEEERHNQAKAKELYTKCLSLCWKLENLWGIGHSLEKVARSAAAYGQLVKAAHIFAAADLLLESAGYALEAVEMPGHEISLALLHNGLDAHILAAAWAEGQIMPLEQVVAEALNI